MLTPPTIDLVNELRARAEASGDEFLEAAAKRMSEMLGGGDTAITPQTNIVQALANQCAEIAQLISQRDKATAELEGIAAFDGGQAGDVACRFLIDANVWTTRMQRMDNKPLALPPHVPHRGSDVEAWLKRARDNPELEFTDPSAKWSLERLVNDYQLHADTGTPLDQVAPDGGDPENQGAHL